MQVQCRGQSIDFMRISAHHLQEERTKGTDFVIIEPYQECLSKQ